MKVREVLELSNRPGRPLVEKQNNGQATATVAVICDFLEEHWPSMDQAGDMLCQYLVENHSQEISVTQVRPAFNRRFTRSKLLPGSMSWNADRLLNRFIDYPLNLRDREFDLFHLIDHSYGQLVHHLRPERTVVTCHDLDTFRCLFQPQQEKRPYWFRAMTSRILEGFLRAAHVICISNATREELLLRALFPPERLTVIHIGTHPAFSPFPDANADAELHRLLPSISRTEPWLVHVGSTIPRKRIDVLLRTFAGVRCHLPQVRLVRVGGGFTPSQSRLIKDLGLEEAIHILPFISTPVLASLYRRAKAVLQTSEAEGFGMPVTEALACGCPVIASDLAVFHEVGGSAVIYCPVGDVPAWVRSILGVISHEERWNTTRELLQQTAPSFSWADNARRTLEVYQHILQQ
jgi:glycosyltransferase involved in cell wall biosynthesis